MIIDVSEDVAATVFGPESMYVDGVSNLKYAANVALSSTSQAGFAR